MKHRDTHHRGWSYANYRRGVSELHTPRAHETDDSPSTAGHRAASVDVLPASPAHGLILAPSEPGQLHRTTPAIAAGPGLAVRPRKHEQLHRTFRRPYSASPIDVVGVA